VPEGRAQQQILSAGNTAGGGANERGPFQALNKNIKKRQSMAPKSRPTAAEKYGGTNMAVPRTGWGGPGEGPNIISGADDNTLKISHASTFSKKVV